MYLVLSIVVIQCPFIAEGSSLRASSIELLPLQARYLLFYELFIAVVLCYYSIRLYVILSEVQYLLYFRCY